MIRGLATSRNRRRLTAVLLGLAALMLAPLLHLGWTFDWSAYTHFSTNYRHAWRVARMGDYALNSILVSFCAVGLVTIVGSLAAYGLAKLRFRGRSVLTLLLLSGLAIPGVLLMVPLFVMLKDWTVFGFSFSNSRVGLAVIYAALSLPFTTFLLSAFYRNLPTALAKAAVIDGAGPWHVFSEVYFPLSAPALATASIFNFLGIWNEYHFALVFLTNPDYRTLPVGLYNLQVSQQFATNWPAMFAGIVILCLPTFLIFILLQERIVAGLAIGGVKG
jgi:N-acetylglucosamine transport system permease protein